MNPKLILILSIMPFLFGSKTAYAQSMTNSIYKLAPINPNSLPSSSQDNQTQPPQQENTKTDASYTVRQGFPLLKSNLPFTLSLSSPTINFGTLNAGEAITRTVVLNVSNPSTYGYQIIASQNNSLKTPDGQEIHDTTCDAGTCTQSLASEWINPLTYGFGYRCDNLEGNDCASDFENKTYYKQYSNLKASENPQSIMSSNNSGKNSKTQITFKINVSGTQSQGIYQNEIFHIAVPNY